MKWLNRLATVPFFCLLMPPFAVGFLINVAGSFFLGTYDAFTLYGNWSFKQWEKV